VKTISAPDRGSWPPAAALLLGAALVCWGVAEAILVGGSWSAPARCAFAVFVLGSAIFAERHPWPVMAIQVAAISAQAQFGVFDTEDSVTPLQGITIAGWTAGSALRRTPASALLAAALAGIFVAVGSAEGLPTFGVTLGVGIGWAGSRVAREVRERGGRLARRLDAAEQDPGALSRFEVDAERDRLARELDVIVLDTARQIDADASRAEAALREGASAAAPLESIATGAAEAMGRIREALAILRDGADAESRVEAEGLAAAITSLRSRGVRVEVRDDGEATSEGALTLTRILELLVVSPHPPRRLRLVVGGGTTTLKLRYPTADATTSGESLVRIRERALLRGGSVRLRRGGRTAVVRLPETGRRTSSHRRRPALLAGAALAALTALDLWTEASAPPLVGGTVAVVLSFAVTTWVWSRRPLALAAFAFLPIARDTLVGFDGLEATTIPLLAAAAFLPSLWLEDEASRRRLATVVALAALALLLTSWAADGVIITDVPIIVVLVAAGWWLGAAVRTTGVEADRLAERGWATSSADLAAAARAVADERLRISRDLHDLVAHGLAIVSVQAWSAHAALVESPGAAADGLAAIREATSAIVDELEHLIRPTDDDAGTDIGLLVAHAREAGLPVAIEGGLPANATAGAAIFGPVVREALTNVIRHAGLVPTTVVLRSSPAGLEAEVRNAPGGTGARSGGLGLAGMRERLVEAGGSLEAGPLADGGFRVRARLPASGPRATHPGPQRSRTMSPRGREQQIRRLPSGGGSTGSGS
jgi:signal transduction histidine kinase